MYASILIFSCKQDIKSEIRRVAGFLDVKITKDEVDSVAEKCSFEYMRDSACGTPLQDMVQLFRKGNKARES